MFAPAFYNKAKLNAIYSACPGKSPSKKIFSFLRSKNISDIQLLK
jgi:hypothetical protein